MKQLLIITFICLSFIPTYAEESYQSQQKIKKLQYAQKVFRKRLQRRCGYTAAHWAQLHTKVEWTNFQTSGTFKEEFAHMCPKGMKVAKDKWMEPLYLFATEYAKDSGNRPRC